MVDQTNVKVKDVADYLGLASGLAEFEVAGEIELLQCEAVGCDEVKEVTVTKYDYGVYDFELKGGSSNSFYNADTFIRVDSAEYNGQNAVSLLYANDPSSNHYNLRQVLVLADGKTFARDLANAHFENTDQGVEVSSPGVDSSVNSAYGLFSDDLVADVKPGKASALVMAAGNEVALSELVAPKKGVYKHFPLIGAEVPK